MSSTRMQRLRENIQLTLMTRGINQDAAVRWTEDILDEDIRPMLEEVFTSLDEIPPGPFGVDVRDLKQDLEIYS